MKIGYARVSTKDQTVDLQLDALKQAGCERIYQEVASGAKTARPELDRLLVDIRTGDTIVIWKLDRLGRSLKHLVELVGKLAERKIGLLSLNDPVDTTNAQGRLVFNLFASLAEFERELIQERTLAGLSAARARGRVGGRPKGLSAPAESTAMAAETLYREGRLSVSAIGRSVVLMSFELAVIFANPPSTDPLTSIRELPMATVRPRVGISASSSGAAPSLGGYLARRFT